MRRRRATNPKPKKVAYQLIRRDTPFGRSLYAILADLVEAYHEDLREARIALAWNLAWKADVDGRVTLGMCRKASDLDRELTEFDFVIILRKEFFENPVVTDEHRRALLDHELCHAAVKLGPDGEPVVDERNRTVYRIRKHDIEEFTAIVDRHGCWKKDLEAFGRALERAKQKADEPTFIGVHYLRERLRQVGVEVSKEAIGEWTDHQRREANAWAILRHELRNAPAPLLTNDAQPTAEMPIFMAAVATLNPPPTM